MNASDIASYLATAAIAGGMVWVTHRIKAVHLILAGLFGIGLTVSAALGLFAAAIFPAGGIAAGMVVWCTLFIRALSEGLSPR